MASFLLSSQIQRPANGSLASRLRRIVARALASWHLASLDAPTVAIVWSLAIAHSAATQLKPWFPLLLGCGTWTVYVGDRLLDARRAIKANNLGVLRERHYFHWRHRPILVPIALLTAASSIGMIFGLMSLAARERNSLIASAAIAYFSGVHASAPIPRWIARIISKEFLVGILFAAGCSAPTMQILRFDARALPVILSVVFLCMLAWLNCAAIASWENEAAVTSVPDFALLLSLAGFGLAITFASSFAVSSLLLTCAAISALLILVLHQRRSHVHPLTLRALADLVLLVPAVLLIPGVTRS